MKRISCEVCGSNDLLKQDNVFVCQNCGCKYSAEEIKRQIVEVAGSIQVKGIDDADTLYNTALDWLNLGNENMAIKVLDDMTNKYPGDKRGWQKLARLKPDKCIIDNAVRLGDNELLEEWESVAKAACEDVRNGRGEKWLIGYNHSRFVLQIDEKFQLFSCVEKLLDEGIEIAKYFNDYYDDYFDDWKSYTYNKPSPSTWSKALGILWIGENREIYPLTNEDIRKGDARIIIGNIVVFSNNAYLCKKVINKAVIQQTFQEIENLVKNKLCPFCGRKRGFSMNEGKCPKCKKYVAWFY